MFTQAAKLTSWVGSLWNVICWKSVLTATLHVVGNVWKALQTRRPGICPNLLCQLTVFLVFMECMGCERFRLYWRYACTLTCSIFCLLRLRSNMNCVPSQTEWPAWCDAFQYDFRYILFALCPAWADLSVAPVLRLSVSVCKRDGGRGERELELELEHFILKGL